MHLTHQILGMRLPAGSRHHIRPFCLIVPVKASNAAYIKMDQDCRDCGGTWKVLNVAVLEGAARKLLLGNLRPELRKGGLHGRET